MKHLWKDYNLSVVLAALFLASWVGQAVVQFLFAHETWDQFWVSTLENWQSEFLQLLTFVTLTSFLIHRGSPESKDSDEEMQASLTRIEERLKTLEGKDGNTTS